MTSRTRSEDTPSPAIAPSRTLLAAALAGLFGASGCASDGPSGGTILSSVVDPDMTLDTFQLECDERGGTVELHAHCGGANSCSGFSYDEATDVLTEHTCQALNTCSGFSCVIPEGV